MEHCCAGVSGAARISAEGDALNAVPAQAIPSTTGLESDGVANPEFPLVWRGFIPPFVSGIEVPSRSPTSRFVMTLRSIAYCSEAVSAMTQASLAELTARARARNERLAITGSLAFLWGQFVQIIEGPPAAVGAVFSDIVADKRHRAVVVMLDQETTQRWFPDFALECRTVESLSETEKARLDASLRSAKSGSVPRELGFRTAETIAGIAPDWVMDRLRVAPRQPRALLAVDRLIDSGGRKMVESGLQGLTVDRVAKDAGVSKQAAYRYFSTPDDILRALVRRIQARRFAELMLLIERSNFASDADIPRILVGAATRGYLASLSVPGVAQSLVLHLLRHHHEIAYDKFWEGAVRVQAAMARCGLPADDPMLIPRLAAVAGGIAGSMKTLALQNPALLRSADWRNIFTDMALAAIRGQSRPSLQVGLNPPLPHAP
jgi:AcrR family transcriptional regulator